MTFTPVDLVRLHSGIKGMTPSLMRNILQSCVDHSFPLSDVFQMDESDLTRLYPQMNSAVATRLISSTIDGANKTLEQLQGKGFSLITFLDKLYPFQDLPYVGSMPPLLYVYGDPHLLHKPGVGFGGSRSVSRDGLHATDQLARSVVTGLGCTVISGHAKGVDIMAHQSALAVNGETILVLPEGALTFRLNDALRAYWSEAKDRIGIVTQFAPNEPWHVRNAMARNGTVIGLSKAFCVIESGDETGGTWEAGSSALNKKVPLYVLDYPNPPESASGNRKLIDRGGIPILFAQELSFPAIDSSPKTIIQNQLL